MGLPDTMFCINIFVKVPDNSSSHNQMIADLDFMDNIHTIYDLKNSWELAVVLELLWEKDAVDRGNIFVA